MARSVVPILRVPTAVPLVSRRDGYGESLHCEAQVPCTASASRQLIPPRGRFHGLHFQYSVLLS